MLSDANLAVLKRSNLGLRKALAARMDIAQVGVEVVILQDGRYNGPDHNTLGECKAGDVVTIAGGEYYAFLKNREMVISVADAESTLSTEESVGDKEPVPEPTPTKRSKKSTAGADA